MMPPVSTLVMPGIATLVTARMMSSRTWTVQLVRGPAGVMTRPRRAYSKTGRPSKSASKRGEMKLVKASPWIAVRVALLDQT